MVVLYKGEFIYAMRICKYVCNYTCLCLFVCLLVSTYLLQKTLIDVSHRPNFLKGAIFFRLISSDFLTSELITVLSYNRSNNS